MPDSAVSRVLGEFQASVEEEARRHGSGGLSFGVLLGDELVWQWHHGFADLERALPVTHQTAYNLASVAKCFVATSVMQLCEAGALRLDDPITSGLPWFRMRGYDPDDPIRVRHLLSHTAGLPMDPPFPIWTTQVGPTREDLMRALPEQDLVFPPGLRAKYSNLGYDLLMYLVESVSGKSLDDAFYRESIFDPLEMSGASLDTQASNVAQGYHRLLGGERKPWIVCPSMLAMTLEDLAHFLSMLLAGGTWRGRRFLRASSVREMQRIHGFLEHWSVGYGLGFYLRPHGSLQIVSHGGEIHGYRSQFALVPEQRLACLALGNADDAPVGRIVFRWIRELSDAIEQERRASSRSALHRGDRGDWDRYLGRYEDILEEYEVRIEDERLTLARPEGGEVLTFLTEVEPHVFRMDGGDYVGEMLRFELDAQGRVARVQYASDFFNPKHQRSGAS